MSEVNIRRLAKEMNLSISTISKALRDSHEISAETKRKVLELAEKLQYTPNPYASSLRRKKSNTIAIVIPEVADSYFSLAINGIETVAREKNYHVIVYLTHENSEREASILKDLSSGRVDGVLISVSSETKNLITSKLKEKARLSRESIRMKARERTEDLLVLPHKPERFPEEELGTPGLHLRSTNEGFAERMGIFYNNFSYT